jgi:putative transposase
MTLYKNTFRVESSRLKDWDYSNDAAYFVTICVHDMKNYFGKVKEDKVELSLMGKIVDEEWLRTGKMRSNIILDEYNIMPNHFHGIIMIMNDNTVETHRMRLDDSFTDARRASLPNIIKGFKSACTSRIHDLGYTDFKWQSRYHDHIIRNEKELFNVRQYIMNNPLKWTFDEYYRNED